VPRSLRELEVLAEVVASVLAVAEEAHVVEREVDAADLAHLEDAVDHGAVVVLVAVVVALVEAVASPEEAVEEDLVEEVSDVRQSPSCLALSYYGVMGKRELFAGTFCRYFCASGDLPICRGCRLIQSSNECYFTNEVPANMTFVPL
jgi:hypothetical protein